MVHLLEYWWAFNGLIAMTICCKREGYCKKRPYGLWPMALWLCGLMALGFFLLLLLITQRHYSHPGSTGSMQAAKVRKLLIDCIL